jgi:octaprenyl-diphosphate synthase
MVDDLLDFTADEKVLGKPVNNDLREGKLTLPVIYMLRKAGTAGTQTVSAVLADRGFDRVSREDLLRLARDHGALDEARALALRYADAARKDLSAFERSPFREALEVLPDFIVARDH